MSQQPEKPRLTIAQQAGPAAPMVSEKEFKKTMQDAVNYYRSLHESQPLSLSEELCLEAKRYANLLTSYGKLEYSKEKEDYFGDCLFTCYVNKSPWTILEEWYKEMQHYNFDRPGYETHHRNFTQLVWKSSTLMGVGVAYDSAGVMFAVCRFAPQGSVKALKPDLFKVNVVKAVKSPQYASG